MGPGNSLVNTNLQTLPYLACIPTVPLYSKCWPSLLPEVLGTQNLRPHSRSPESESAFFQDSKHIHVDMKC